MNCPVCKFPDSKVLETRDSGDGIRRRRACLECGHRFTTHERIELRLPLVVKKDGQREPFERDKIVVGLQIACRKRPVSAEQLEAVAAAVEASLLATGAAEVPSSQVGRLVLDELLRVDPVAYLRFASVYLELQSPTQFAQLLEPWLPRADGPRPAPGPETLE